MTGTLAHKLGVCQWFDFAAYGDVKRAVAELRALGVRHLRTGLSWAEYEQPCGAAWYDWLFEQLSGFELLVSIGQTPPSRAERGTPASPPRRLADYGAFVRAMLERYGHRFSDIELWNQPTSLYRWDFAGCDPDWSKLAAMIAPAAAAARRYGVRTVLGGMLPVDHHWLALMRDHGALEHIDVVAIHGFPQMWWEDAPCWDRESSWQGWDEKIAYIRAYTEGRPVWVTETGFATWDAHAERPGRYRLQAELLQQAARAPAERVYWRGLIDQDPARGATWGFHVDENEYHLGLMSCHGDRKPAWGIMKHLLAGAHARPLTQPRPVVEIPRL
jgi:CDP-paratose 2-epimerase